jgi:uncharacterized protein (DUF2141 family)
MTRLARILLCCSLGVTMANAAPTGGTLTVEVFNVRAARGSVRIDVCPSGQFLTDHCPWHGAVPARVGTTSVTVTGLPAGRYAVQAYLDENDDSKVDRGMFGLPKEGIGFSNDAKVVLGPPKFNAAAFDFDGISGVIKLKLRYFLGPSGPMGW